MAVWGTSAIREQSKVIKIRICLPFAFLQAASCVGSFVDSVMRCNWNQRFGGLYKAWVLGRTEAKYEDSWREGLIIEFGYWQHLWWLISHSWLMLPQPPIGASSLKEDLPFFVNLSHFNVSVSFIHMVERRKNKYHWEPTRLVTGFYLILHCDSLVYSIEFTRKYHSHQLLHFVKYRYNCVHADLHEILLNSLVISDQVNLYIGTQNIEAAPVVQSTTSPIYT